MFLILNKNPNKAAAQAWIDRGCDPEKMTLGLGAYGRAFRSTSGRPERLQPGNSKGTIIFIYIFNI